MTRIDQFESLFHAADKPLFHYREIAFERILVVTDLTEYQATLLEQRVRGFFGEAIGQRASWKTVTESSLSGVPELLEEVEAARPDLVCAYRNLGSTAWRWPFSLGEHLDVLTQVLEVPVLVLPRPEELAGRDEILSRTQSVTVVTDHLTGDERLVSAGAQLTARGGSLRLVHVEDEGVFERLMTVIGKIPEIDTEAARQRIAEQLLKEPWDYIERCRSALVAARPDLTVEGIVVMGSHIETYERLVEEHGVDLLVLNTKDTDQIAMHGLAYPLLVELRRVPILAL